MRSNAAEYRLNAVNCATVAEQSDDPAIRADLLATAHAWCTLADQAERNSRTDLVYETPDPQPVVQQQQIQPNKE
jgi:hypothetical protein